MTKEKLQALSEQEFSDLLELVNKEINRRAAEKSNPSVETFGIGPGGGGGIGPGAKDLK